MHRIILFLTVLILIFGSCKTEKPKAEVVQKIPIEKPKAPEIHPDDLKAIVTIVDDSSDVLLDADLTQLSLDDLLLRYQKETETYSKLIQSVEARVDSIRSVNKGFNKEVSEACREFWDFWREKKATTDKFRQHILSELIDSNEDHMNASFLKEVMDFDGKWRKTKIVEHPIMPVFTVRRQYEGIASDTYHPAEAEVYAKKSRPELGSQTKLQEFGLEDSYQIEKDLPFVLNQRKVFVTTSSGEYERTIKTVSHLTTACGNFNIYLFDAPLNSSDFNLFATRKPIELEYGNYPDVDEIIIEEKDIYCVDCPHSTKEYKTLARLSGFLDIYVVSTPKNTPQLDLNLPTRALFFVKGNTVIDLWSASYDAFGCSCL